MTTAEFDTALKSAVNRDTKARLEVISELKAIFKALDKWEHVATINVGDLMMFLRLVAVGLTAHLKQGDLPTPFMCSCAFHLHHVMNGSLCESLSAAARDMLAGGNGK